jgi:hypothetical protein
MMKAERRRRFAWFEFSSLESDGWKNKNKNENENTKYEKNEKKFRFPRTL